MVASAVVANEQELESQNGGQMIHRVIGIGMSLMGLSWAYQAVNRGEADVNFMLAGLIFAVGGVVVGLWTKQVWINREHGTVTILHTLVVPLSRKQRKFVDPQAVRFSVRTRLLSGLGSRRHNRRTITTDLLHRHGTIRLDHGRGLSSSRERARQIAAFLGVEVMESKSMGL